MIDPEAVTLWERQARAALEDPAKYHGNAQFILDLIEDWMRLRAALERIRDSQESDLSEYGRGFREHAGPGYIAEIARQALEGGQG